MSGQARVDNVRASRDGHEYHEAWTARLALQLLWPDTELLAIAVEGLSPVDQASASAQAIEIADITLYYGESPGFERSSRVRVVQFKYSVADADKDFRASHAKKTIRKFAAMYRENKEKYSAAAVQEKLNFELITNRPIYGPLLRAIDAIALGLPRTGEVAEQAKQFEAATGIHGASLAAYARKFKLLGQSGSLREEKAEVAALLADWSAGNDALAKVCLGDLRKLVRDKAGCEGIPQNCITRTDILAALAIADADDLLPCMPALSNVGTVVKREQLADAEALIPSLSIPLLIHGEGGGGKTIFMSSLAASLEDHHEVLFFDCFGGGAYRSVDDARHLPQSGLIHIANTLAFHGFCDPMLPGSTDARGLMRTFRRRLIQCIATISRATQGRELVLFIDAIDNADIAARERGEDCFPIELLESVATKPIPGLKLIVSCRTERKPATYAKYHELKLRPFSKPETSAFLRARLRNVSQVEINVAQSRSGGNPRILDHLAMSDRGLLDESEIDKKIEVDKLILKRISDALSTAIERGCDQRSIDEFLAGLAVLPPPVPLDECASALGTDESAVKSFVSDLFPLLERTSQGLTFRDEPTETLIRRSYASSVQLLRRVAENLLARQGVSVYAARALPGLLRQLDDGEKLFALAFENQIPASITSTVGKRNIRYARLKAATLHAAMKKDANQLVQLLVELSTIAVADQRGATYILDHPDLVVAARDVDATRRLFETRTGWPGTRHARLAIANVLSGEFEEATRNLSTAKEWINHYYRQTDHERRRIDPGPERPDIAAIPFFLISAGRAREAADYLRGWQAWYAYEVCEHVFDYSRLAQALGSQSPRRLSRFVGELTGIGPLAAALSFREFRRPKRKQLIGRLAGLCRKTPKLHVSKSYQRHTTYQLEDGLRKAGAMALSLGLDAEALAIAARAPHQRPGLSSYRDVFYHQNVFPFLFHTALVAAVKKQSLHEKDVLPDELVPICSRIRKTLAGKQFLKKAKERLSKCPRKQRSEDESEQHPHALSYETRQAAERFIDYRLDPLLAFARALSAVLAASSRSVDKAFLDLLEVWEGTRKTHDPYRSGETSHFFKMLGLDAALFAFWVRNELTPASVGKFLSTIHSQNVGVDHLVQIVSILAKRPRFQELAGEQALKARKLIEAEQDVESRATLFGSLGRAMLSASTVEASAHFRNGLEQMDAIGSGDYRLVNELLSFAAAIKGDELEERDVHTLENICELNMGEEPEKFPWGAYGHAMSKAAGLRGLATLSRWDDRARISLSHTLLPYLTALVENGKLAPKDAIALNHLAEPVEYFDSGSSEFSKAIRDKAGPDPVVISELIQQFEDNNPGVPMDSTFEALAALAKEALGPSSETAAYLSAAAVRYGSVRETLNEHGNYRGAAGGRRQERAEDAARENSAALERIASDTDTRDETSLGLAISDLNELQYAYEFKGDLFAALRAKLRFAERAKYIRDICALEHFSLYWKLAELKECKQAWARSSAALAAVYESEAVPLIRLHADDLMDGVLLSSQIKEISDLTGVSSANLILDLVTVAARPNRSIAGAIWLAFGSFVCPQAQDGQGQLALERLLGSDTARLAENAANAPWENELYPKNDVPLIASGLVWRALGSPYAETRWHAAHSIRCFARFERWEVVDLLVRHLNSKDAGAFQTPELAFYYLHARLWLLMALARMALDHPREIARFKGALLPIAIEQIDPHVLMRHFAARALLSCSDADELKLSTDTERSLRVVDISPYARQKMNLSDRDDSYHRRPDSIPKPGFEFHFDYDFHKHDVNSLSRVFGKSCWEVADMISAIVHRLEPQVSSMYETGGRYCPHRSELYEISTRHHTYGQQLGWHALFIAAGKLLETFPVADDPWYEEDPWEEWLGRYTLTRNDGLWLSDGTGRKPLDTVTILLEKRDKGLEITGDPGTVLGLAGLTSCVGRELVVKGRWFSADNIEVHISSALVPPDRATCLAKKLAREEPMLVWIPVFDETEGDLGDLRGDKREYTPWIVCPSGIARLDEHDPYGVPDANLRPRLGSEFLSSFSLVSDDPFGRIWHDKRGRPILRAQAWGREGSDSDRGPRPGLRLSCASSALKKILTKHDKELLLLIKLQRYRKEHRRNSSWTHTIAVVRISKTLDLECFKEHTNRVHKPRY